MASSDTQNVAVNSQSVGESPIDVHAKTPNSTSAINGNPVQSTAPAVQDPENTTTVEVNDTSSSGSTSKANGQAQQVDGTDAHVNGSGHHVDQGSVADTASVQGSVPDFDSRDAGSVGDAAISDTDSRGEAGEQTKDANGHPKSGAIKKPTSFKAVSVTKNFLAKTATSTPTVKAGEKLSVPTAMTTPQTVARPRLVAKSGSGLRDTPRTRTGTDGPTEGSTVWNKNRPAPPQPPKQFTDEELKQQYGIHLASRIQVDEGPAKSKWADIDDEEDDWAPETVEWMDGTKSKISAEPIQPVKPSAQAPAAEAKPAMIPLKRPVASGPPKTILRPGAAQQMKQDTSGGKGTSDQKGATLTAKATSTTPVKSPWAPLPPVDKSTPIFEPPPPPPATAKPPFGSQDARLMDNDAPLVRHEIEADTFDRAWRDSSTGPRELFNSQSGRYEPAPEGRRGSVRHDQGYRQAAVLQRPTPEGEESQPLPQRSQMDGSPWGRRRGSSINQGAQAPERRVSITQSTDQAPPPAENRTGVVIGHDIGPQARKASDAAQKMQEQINARNEELAKQKRIMLEKREAAIQRRKEEEEREEAEKRERIRLKLESLGLPPLEKKEATAGKDDKKAEATSQPQQTSHTISHGAVHSNPPSQDSQSQDAQTVQSASASSQPLANVHSDPGLQQNTQQTPLAAPHAQSAKSQTSVPTKGTQDNSVPVSSYSSPGDQKAQPTFKSPALVADSFATWGNRTTSGHGAPNSNVWGPPIAGRHIGNGAFDSSFGRIPPRLQNQHNIGQTFAGPQTTRSPSAGNRQQETSPMRHQQMLSDQNLASLGLVDTPTDSFPSVASAGPSPMPVQAQPVSLPPIGPPPQRHIIQPFQQQAPRGPAAWGQFAAQAQNEPRPAYNPNRPPPTVNNSAPPQTWRETFKQTKATGDWHGGPRNVVGAEKIVRGQQQIPPTAPSPAPPMSQSQSTGAGAQIASQGQENTVRLPTGPSVFPKTQSPHAPLPQRAPQTLPAHPMGAHQSRFFPTASLHGGSPPPEESSHPVQSGDRSQPKVNLPHPKPKVRLPQSASPNAKPAHPSPVIMPQGAPSFRGVQPLVQSSDWQARFNGLFGRINTTTATPPSPPKTPPKIEAIPSPAPVSSTKADLFDVRPPLSATVSLPYRFIALSLPDAEMGVKPMSDELFDGELSFGSTPNVAVPRNPDYTFGPDRSDRAPHILKMRPSAAYDRRVTSFSKVDDIESLLDKPINVATIKLSSTTMGKDVELPVKITPKRRFEDKRKVSGKFAKSPKIGSEKENEASPVGTPAKMNGPEKRVASQAKGPRVPKGFKGRSSSERFAAKEEKIAGKAEAAA
ncbi:hypothetical protein CAC42_5307 [Sphaceloma murrayae]|uniref:Uncharacterized protein n=1 Tax=Sphaceloma murrayae TaxID=2082308 RepID=A0A2K1QUM8_9PEZI|nr:hypothetical protein CAC42_5307 [Sphaceloma murrayae]